MVKTMKHTQIFAFALLLITTIGCAATMKKNTRPNYKVGITKIDYQIKSGEKLNAIIWYPTLEPSGEVDYETSIPMRDAMAKQFKMPRFSISTKTTTQASTHSPIAEGKHPVVFFSHGFASFARQNNKMMEHFAKNGYIIVAISNPKASLLTEYTNGDYIQMDRTTPAMVKLDNLNKKRVKIMAKDMADNLNAIKNSDHSNYIAQLKQLGNDSLFSKYAPYVDNGARNLIQSIDAFSNQPQPVFQHMDLSNIALVGHSLGAMISIEASRQLAKQKTPVALVINYDAPGVLFEFQQGIDLTNYYASPVCVFQGNGTQLAKHNIGMTGVSDRSVQSNSFGGCLVNIEKAHHNNFTDLTHQSILKLFGMLGKINGKKFGHWLNASSVDILDFYLQPHSKELNITPYFKNKQATIEVFYAR
ncbi:hypothetical protein [Marinicellulosiphila megalodicopiae]|uniref:alpha/beta hydrolase n=1 Tax=Marinicellulosiphila megalodicopiae TaxID=2724896 RepID=UPI003BB0B21C